MGPEPQEDSSHSIHPYRVRPLTLIVPFLLSAPHVFAAPSGLFDGARFTPSAPVPIRGSFQARPEGPKVPAEDLEKLEAMVLGAQKLDAKRTWPGYRVFDSPVLFQSKNGAYLAAHRNPPSGFIAIDPGDLPPGSPPIYVNPKGLENLPSYRPARGSP